MNSLAVRLFFSATVWIILTLLAAGLLLSDLNKKSNFAAFDDRLNLLLETLIGASRVDSSDSITVVSSIGDPRFFQPYSGWYWQVNNGAQTVSRSRSMWDQVFTSDKRLIGGRSQFRDSVMVENTSDSVIESKKLHIVERQISFPGISNPINFLVSGDTKEYMDNVKKFNDTLLVTLVVLGVGLMIAVFLQVNYGLLPLNKIKQALFKIRNGDKKKLEAQYPLEVQPLATEINELLEHNEKIVERAKTHVGNLAHVLKTPLAVISNEVGSNHNGVLKTQIVLMQKHIDRYLKKAHLQAVGKSVKSKIEFMQFLKKMVKIFDKIYPNITIDFPYNFREFFVFGSLEDMEEVVGNVLENGCKYGKTKIKISIIKISDVEIRIQIADDGEGLPTKKMNEVFAWGFRLDEQTQGTGLGLNIVKDIVEVYKGKVWLEKSKELGGLQVNINLPISII